MADHELDTISLNLKATGSGQDFTFVDKGIAWPGEKKKYNNEPNVPDWSQVAVPPNWQDRYPNNYTNDNHPRLADDEHFQNWMRTAGLPTFTKLYGRNDADTLKQGTYELTIDLREILTIPLKCVGSSIS
jgi:hypothetical protein